jgi:hypothetical protein
VAQALHEDEWIKKLTVEATISIEHLTQFVQLWALIQNVQLNKDVEDDIRWKLTGNGQYSAASAYKLQFFGLIETPINKVVWKAWAPPKVKNHTWLASQNRLWTSDKLRRRGWENCGLCPLYKQTEESNNHLFIHCRYTVRIWELLKEWLGIQGVFPRRWAGLNIKQWRSFMEEGSNPHRKDLASLTLLTVWVIWKERNARVFHKKLSPSFVILDKIKCEARLSVIAGARRLGDLMPGE